jgi:hypothetical protein
MLPPGPRHGKKEEARENRNEVKRMTYSEPRYSYASDEQIRHEHPLFVDLKFHLSS